MTTEPSHSPAGHKLASVECGIIVGQMSGGTARSDPGTARHGTPRQEKDFVPCRAAQRAVAEAQAWQ